MHHVRAICLRGIWQKSWVELSQLCISLLFDILPRMAVVWRRDGGDVELGVVGSRCLARFRSGWGRELPVETRSVSHRASHVGWHGWGRRGGRHARWDGHARFFGRVDLVDVAAFSIALLVGAPFHALFPLLALGIDAFLGDSILDATEAGTGVVALLAGLLAVCTSVLHLPAFRAGRLRWGEAGGERIYVHLARVSTDGVDGHLRLNVW